MSYLFMLVYKGRGFTILEILVVVFIMTIMTAIAIPNFNNYQPNLKLSAAAKNLTEDLRYAQQLTITSQEAHFIYLNAESGHYYLQRFDSSATTTLKAVALPEGIIFDQDETDLSLVRFNAYGGASIGSSGQIIVKNVNNKAITIFVKPSGYVELSN